MVELIAYQKLGFSHQTLHTIYKHWDLKWFTISLQICDVHATKPRKIFVTSRWMAIVH